MTNAWSLLYDTMTESLGEDVYEQILKENYDYDFGSDGYGMISKPAPPSEDTIVFSGSRLSGGMSNDHITFLGDGINAAQPVPYDSFMGIGEDVLSFDLTMDEKTNLNKKNKYKYNEDVILKEVGEYITGTYQQHYSAGDDEIQTLDLIEACGDGESFCRSNILKYASRYDKKGTARRDIMKILHYAVLLMHFNDKNAQRETYPQ